MGVYIYTPRAEVKQMEDGVQVARLTYAFKDFDIHYAPASWIRTAACQESAGGRAAAKHNSNGVSLLARCDKFEVGAPVYEIVNNNMRFAYYDNDMGDMKCVGELVKRGRKWAVKYN